MALIILFLALGVVLLYFGAEMLVHGSSNLALRLGVSSLVVGLTVVAFGTSAPELVVSVGSGLKGLGDIALGNVVGSNIFNGAAILGLAAMIRPMKVNIQVLRIDTPIMVTVSALLILFLRDSRISRIEGLFLTACIVAYVAFTVYAVRKDAKAMGQKKRMPKGNIPIDLGLVIAGLFALVYGSKFFVKGAVDLAHRFSISEALIGLTIVAAGTSLPELATSVVAAFKKEEDIAIGNIIGSNIFNILAILGISSLLTPLTSTGIGYTDLGFLLATSMILLPFMRTGFTISRLEGLVLFLSYAGYLWWLWP
jgi:cation:H+ antiporter